MRTCEHNFSKKEREKNVEWEGSLTRKVTNEDCEPGITLNPWCNTKFIMADELVDQL